MDRKNAGNAGGYDLVVMCKFSYSMDGMTYRSLGIPFRVKEGRWIGAKKGLFCTRPSIQTNDGGWTDVDWFRIGK